MPLRMRWPKVVKIYWCSNCNVPLIGDTCSKCNCKGFKLNLVEPCDARLALDADYLRIKEGVLTDFNSEELYDKLFKDNIILLNKVPYLDEMRQVIVNGIEVGKVYFDPIKQRWRFRLSYAGATYAVLENIVEVVKVHDKIKQGDILLHGASSNEVIIVNTNNDPIGIGYKVDDGKIRVHAIFRRKEALKEVDLLQLKSSSLDYVLKANEYHLYVLESKAKAFLYVMSSKVQKSVVVSYSGGKDSLVCLSLALDTGLNVEMLFNDTGLEFNETINKVYEAAEKFNLNLHIAEPEVSFWDSIRVFGPPARDYRWCCKVLKLTPLARKSRRMWPSGALNIVGQRAFESLERARSQRVWRNKWVPHLLSISPIQEWGQLAIWLYIHKHKLWSLVNPLYRLGYERIGCWLCPASTLAEFNTAKNIHPELWCRWELELEKWRKTLNHDKYWITLGLWRWLGPSTAKKQLLQKAKLGTTIQWINKYTLRTNPRILNSDVSKANGLYNISIKFSDQIPISKVSEQVKSILKARIEDEEHGISINLKEGKVNISETSLSAIISETGLEDLIDVLKIIYRTINCIGCKSCETWCPGNAIAVTMGGVSIESSKCISCRLCLDVCPICEMLVDRVVAGILLRKPDAWRRKTKRHREVVLKFMKEILSKNT